jgi:hypothetical protein
MVDDLENVFVEECLQEKVTALSLDCVGENHRTAAWHLQEAITFHDLAASALEVGNMDAIQQNKNSAKLHHLLAIEYIKLAERIVSNINLHTP